MPNHETGYFVHRTDGKDMVDVKKLIGLTDAGA